MNLSENLRERPKFVTEPKRILIPGTKKKLAVNISNCLINILIYKKIRGGISPDLLFQTICLK